MKKILILLSALMIGCTLFGDTANYNITFDIPVRTDLKMNIYKWEGKDTLTCPFYAGINLDKTSSFYLKSLSNLDVNIGAGIFEATADGDSTYISIVGQYESPSGLLGESTWATVLGSDSHFLLSKEKNLSSPINVKISG